MTTKEIIRLNIDDPIQIGFANEISVGGTNVYQMNSRNIWDVTIRDHDGALVDPEVYEIFQASGQIQGDLPEGEITFQYKHAAFSDAELDYFLGNFADSTTKATLACIEILLASASKRFDYKAGLKDIKASQVFDHLKDLRDDYKEKVNDEDDANGLGEVGLFVNREHPAYATNLNVPNQDVSRSDL